MNTRLAAVLSCLLLSATNAYANQWHAGPGIAFVGNIDKVIDVYEQNLANEGKTVDVSKSLPVGVSFDVHYQYDRGLRIGFGLGPFFRLSGSTTHTEFPINGTVGYTFSTTASASGFVKGGIVHHFATGDYYSTSDPGFLGAAGLELARHASLNFTIEISVDQSNIELNTVCGNVAGCTAGVEKLHSYQAVLSFYVKF